jgi:hypothetical protein
MFDNYRDETEIMDLLERDYENSIISAEAIETELQELQDNIQEANDYIEEIENTSINVDGLIEFLSDRNLLTDTLKNEIEYYKKFMEVY